MQGALGEAGAHISSPCQPKKRRAYYICLNFNVYWHILAIYDLESVVILSFFSHVFA
jgi:hypothetical protein